MKLGPFFNFFDIHHLPRGVTFSSFVFDSFFAKNRSFHMKSSHFVYKSDAIGYLLFMTFHHTCHCTCKIHK